MLGRFTIVLWAVLIVWLAMVFLGGLTGRDRRPDGSSQVTQLSAAAEISYTLVDEKISDTPIKTQIEQFYVADPAPTPQQLHSTLLQLYDRAMVRTGFEYNTHPTAVYIHIYGTLEQAQSKQGIWIATLDKNVVNERPEVRIYENRLSALIARPEHRFGLSEAERKQFHTDLSRALIRSTKEAKARIPDTQLWSKPS